MALAFALITDSQSYLYLQDGTYDLDMVKVLQQENVLVKDYRQIYADGCIIKRTCFIKYKQS